MSHTVNATLGRTLALSLFLLGLGQSHAWSAPPPGPVFVCQNAVCVFNPSGVDSDGDGFSDADERLAGTDPRDPRSHPTVLALIKRWHAGQPGFKGVPFREVIVLPETAPDGKTIGRSPLVSLPGRKEAIAALGLNNAFLGGHDLSNGLRVALNLRTPTKNAPPPRRVSGIDARLVSEDESTVYPVHHSEQGGEVTEWFNKETGEKVGQDTTVSGEGGCVTKQVCTKSDGCVTATVCPPNVSMSDPDADPGLLPSGGQVLVATPEQIAAFNRKYGSNTTFGPRPVEIDPKASPPTRNRAPVILINPDDDSVWISTQATSGTPTNFNRFGGNVNGGRPDGPQRPRLPFPR